MSKPMRFLLTAGLGAAAMYYMDPSRGRYRRALVRDRLVHGEHQALHGVASARRDARNRASGVAAAIRSMLDRGQAPDDGVLVQRVRACLGRVVSHPHSIRVEANDGVITLSGQVLEDEVPLLFDCTLGVPGVRDLTSHLEVHRRAGNVPGLQGTPRRRPESARDNWPPSVRASGGVAGGLAALAGLVRGGFGGTLMSAGGLLLLTRAVTNLELRRLFGVGTSRHAVNVAKTIHIHAPIEEVFRLWDDFENFPRFMTHVREVRPVTPGQGKRGWHWTVTGPTGTRFEFDSVITAREENRLIAWRTHGSPPVQHAGRVRFVDNGDGSTTVDVRMTYNPVIGAVGHALAWLFGSDPKRQMDDDLMRMKSYLETGRTPRHAAAPPETSRPGHVH